MTPSLSSLVQHKTNTEELNIVIIVLSKLTIVTSSTQLNHYLLLAYLEEEKGDSGLLVGVKTLFDSVVQFDGPPTLGLQTGESCTESVSDDISITSPCSRSYSKKVTLHSQVDVSPEDMSKKNRLESQERLAEMESQRGVQLSPVINSHV